MGSQRAASPGHRGWLCEVPGAAASRRLVKAHAGERSETGSLRAYASTEEKRRNERVAAHATLESGE
jgi:hypothetical protein